MVPSAIHADDAVFFLTICCEPRRLNQLCRPELATALFESINFRQERGDWWMSVVLLMPDHLHALATFPGKNGMARVIGEWKKFTAREFGIRWQRDFFDHRLRHEESLRDKEEYIRQNPVRAGLNASGGDWPHVWTPRYDNRLPQRRGGPPRPTNCTQ